MSNQSDSAAVNKTSNDNKTLDDNTWKIRPCFLYEEEYDDCTSFKARFHQYFIYGKMINCDQWKTDYDHCLNYKKNNDIDSANALIESENKRRDARMCSHENNNIWKRRSSPPNNWNSPLPEWLNKRNENSYLEVKANELKNNIVIENKYCSIM